MLMEQSLKLRIKKPNTRIGWPRKFTYAKMTTFTVDTRDQVILEYFLYDHIFLCPIPRWLSRKVVSSYFSWQNTPLANLTRGTLLTPSLLFRRNLPGAIGQMWVTWCLTWDLYVPRWGFLKVSSINVTVSLPIPLGNNNINLTMLLWCDCFLMQTRKGEILKIKLILKMERVRIFFTW